jgi:hypothetical protein
MSDSAPKKYQSANEVKTVNYILKNDATVRLRYGWCLDPAAQRARLQVG